MHNVQKIVTFFAALALFLALASAASAKRLPLDSSFGERGKTVAEPGPTFDEAIFSAVAPQPDDSILVTRSSGDSVGWLQRYLADGSRDTSYPTVPPPAEPRATQADGKVLERANGASIQRREPDGSPDPTFGTQAWGAAKRSDDVPFTIEQILPLAGGDIVVAGSAYRYEYFDDGEPYRVFDQLAVARFDEGGALDPGFGGGDGIVLLGTDYGFPGQALVGLAPRPGEGTILVTDDLQPNQHGIVFTHAGSALLGLTPAGGFDPSYGAGGVARLSATITAFESPAPGEVVVAGDAWTGQARPDVPSSDFFVSRYGDDGQPAAGFGPDGATVDFGASLDLAKAILVRDDGSILVGGGTTASSDPLCSRFDGFCDEAPAIAAFTASGQPDPNFGGGRLVLPGLTWRGGGAFDNHGVLALAALPGGGVVASGASGHTAFLAELSAAGAYDPGFGDGGLVTEAKATPYANGSAIHDIGIDGDGNTLVAGATNAELTSPTPLSAVFRFGPDGGLDPSYGGRGYVRVPAAAKLSVDPSGAVVAAAGDTPIVLTRVRPDGAIDANFGQAGALELASVGERVDVASVLPLPHQGVLTVGTRQEHPRIVLYRNRADGTPEPNFSGDGLAVRPFGKNHRSQAAQAAIDSKGRVLVAGSVDGGKREAMAVTRIGRDGSIDRRFGDQGVVRLAIGRRSRASAVEALPSGRILVAGRIRNKAGMYDLLLRLQPDGSLDRAFARNGVARVRVPKGESGLLGALRIVKLRHRILVVRRGKSGQIVEYRPGGRVRRTYFMPGGRKGYVARPQGDRQGPKALFGIELGGGWRGSFQLVRSSLR